MQVNAGDRFGRYEVLSRLGAGGMGEVYFASDTRLGRPVALKLLPPELTVDKERLRRFEREARLTSGINHPNLLTVYDIGEEDSAHYIAAEFIDGETLRARINAGPLAASEAIEIALQIGAALAAAHEAGVVHRDIKPENVMLRRDGFVKVLDFGLAKLASQRLLSPAGPEASTASVFETGAGALLGTVLYMSPEQLRGQDVDGRTDVWSLGVVLYEMLTARLPFDRSTKSDAIASILEREPAPLSSAPRGAVADELQRVVSKCLRKEKGARYRSVRELVHDLQLLRRRIEESADDPRFDGVGHATAACTGAATSPPDESSLSAVRTAAVEPAQKTWAFLVVRRRIDARRATLVCALTLAALAGGSAYSYLRPAHAPANKSAADVEFSRLAVAGDVKDAAISPDGRYVAFVADRAGGQSLRVRQVSTPANLQIDASGGRYKGITFSPDGDYIYYRKEEGDSGTLYSMPVIGGSPRKIAARVDSPAAFSPDGSRVAFVRDGNGDGTTALIVVAADGSDERSVAVLRQPQSFNLAGYFSSGPAWSPDGKIIACPAFNLSGRGGMDVAAVRLDDGAVKAFNAQRWSLVEKLVWLNDGAGVVMNARDRQGSPLQLWLLAYPSGEARRITNDTVSYVGLSGAPASGQLLALKQEKSSSLWIAPPRGTGDPQRIVSSRYDGLSGVAWASGGRIVYASNDTGTYNIWIMDADGGERKQLTFGDEPSTSPTVSPDGRSVLFVSYRGRRAHVWRVGSDGEDARQLTVGDFEDSPAYTPDGRWILYHGTGREGDGVWRIPSDGGPAQLVVADAAQPDVSPDGKLVACFLHTVGAASGWRLAIVPLDGGPPSKTFDLPADVTPASSVLRWTPDGRSVTYAAALDGASEIWAQPLARGPAKKLTDFREGQVFSFDWSRRDGRLLCARGATLESLYLLKNFEPGSDRVAQSRD